MVANSIVTREWVGATGRPGTPEFDLREEQIKGAEGSQRLEQQVREKKKVHPGFMNLETSKIGMQVPHLLPGGSTLSLCRLCRTPNATHHYIMSLLCCKKLWVSQRWVSEERCTGILWTVGRSWRGYKERVRTNDPEMEQERLRVWKASMEVDFGGSLRKLSCSVIFGSRVWLKFSVFWQKMCVRFSQNFSHLSFVGFLCKLLVDKNLPYVVCYWKL